MKKLPSVLEKRSWIYNQNIPENELINIGQSYQKELHFNDAIECLKKTQKPELLEDIKKYVIEEGDYFLGKKISDVNPFKSNEWTKLAENAEKKQKIFFARSAYIMVENTEKEQELVQQLKENYQGKYFERL